MTNAINPKTGKPTSFESTACTRCDGNGYIRGYAHVMNGVCFNCGGSGVKYTKRGAAAQAAFSASLTVAPTELSVGQKVHWPAGPFGGARWSTVTELVASDQGVTVVTNVGTLQNWTTPVRVAHTAEAKQAKLAAAVAYQATLTKAGTPRKTSLATAGATS